jgi:hypothetical protein
METKQVREVLSAHADSLVGMTGGPPARFTRNDRIQGLLDLAEELQGILVPVPPNTDYRRRLHGDLILEAQRRQSDTEVSVFQQHRKGILIGAAAVGSVASVAGVVIAFMLRRGRGATHIATG